MATATSKLQIIIDVIGDKAQSGLGKIQSNLSQIAVVAGTVAAAGYTAKKAWDFAKEGAELEKTATQFRNVAENAGYMADVLLGDMRKATGGLVTDAELMQSGLDIIQLGLADSAQGVVDLATVVSTLGLDMQQVILTFANNSEMRLDALGLSVEDVRQRVAELNAEGFDGDAFDQAVLEGLQERMEILGDATETTAGQMQQLETDLENLKNEAKSALAEALSPLVGKMANARENLDLLSEAYELGAISAADFYGISVLIRTPITDQAEITDYLTGKLIEASDADRLFANYQREAATATQEAYSAFGQASSAADFYAMQAEEAARASNVAGAAIRKSGEDAAAASPNLQVAGKAYSDISTNVYSLTQSLQDQLDFLTAGGGALLELAATAQTALDEGNFEGAQLALDAAAQGAVDLDLELGKIDPDEAVQRLMDLGLGPEEAKAKVDEFQSSLFALTSRRYVVQVDVVVNGGNLPPGVSVPGTGGGGTGSGGGNTGGGSAGDVNINAAPGGRFTPGGGAGVIVQVLGDIFLSGDGSFEDFAVSQALNARRNADSISAGAAVTGI